ncbi:MAG TPA: tryptophan halogenase family protein [Sphingomonas sp.]|nr:tryptophan halogenase family protein [Sphingomonas sp.]
MAERAPVRVVVLGGGTAGWMTAAALARLLPGQAAVHVVESAEIGIVGVGEATLPHLRGFLATLGIDEAPFMAATHATYKLGIEFQGWGAPGERYIHPFGTFGQPLAGAAFHHFWLRARAAGRRDSLEDYCTPIALARANRFAPPPATGEPFLTDYNYAFQFDATRFGPYLRERALAAGARRTEGKVVAVEQHPESGDVTALVLESGERITGDLFVDCSGFRSLLLGQTLGEQWEDWSRWLVCDRAVALPCAPPDGPITPYTQAIAMPDGWRWRIPLRHRVGNGYVYSSAYASDDAVSRALLAAIEGEPLAEPRILRFRAGRRRHSWVNNVVGIGLASGFLEPLESTSIHLVQAAITELIELFPTGPDAGVERDAFNAATDHEYDRVRDFLILHYHATRRAGSAFWDAMRAMPIPDSLAERIALFRAAARVETHGKGLFFEPSWLSVLIGQGIVPDRWDQRADQADAAGLARALDGLKAEIARTAAAAPDHAAMLKAPA